MAAPTQRTGFTLLELVTVVAMIGIMAAFAVPSFRQTQADARLRGAARAVANAFAYARSQAIVTERVHMVYFATGAGTDACGNPLVDPAGNNVPILVLDDGPIGAVQQNCCIDAGEAIVTEPAVPNVFWGVNFAPAAAPDDTGFGD